MPPKKTTVSRGEPRQPGQDLGERQASPELDCHTLLERLELFAKHGFPGTVKIGSARDDHDAPGLRVQPQRELERLSRFVSVRSADHIRRQPARRQLPRTDARMNDGNPRKELVPVRQQELERRPPDGNERIDPRTRVLLAQKPHELFAVVPLRQPVEVEEFVEDVDLEAELGSKRRFERLIQYGDPRDQAIVRVEDQHVVRRFGSQRP